MIIKKEQYLKIGEKKVSLFYKVPIRSVFIRYVGDVNIKSLLPEGFIIRINDGKIIIHNRKRQKIILDDLFRYRGEAFITTCKIFDFDRNVANLEINKDSILIWKNLYGSKKIDADDVLLDWDKLTLNWEDIKFDGKNNKYNYIKRIKGNDIEITGKFGNSFKVEGTAITEIRSK